jgi:hypothetical protein
MSVLETLEGGHIGAEGGWVMSRRMWPAIGLIAALILAASPVLAAQTSQMVVAPGGTRAADRCAAKPSLAPGHPTTPAGDDDMPDRSGGARTIDDPSLGPNNKAAAGEGMGLWAQPAGWRQHWVLYLRLLLGR